MSCDVSESATHHWATLTIAARGGFAACGLPAPRLIGPDGTVGACECGSFLVAFALHEAALWVAIPVPEADPEDEDIGRFYIQRITSLVQLRLFVDERLGAKFKVNFPAEVTDNVYRTLAAAWPRA
jgi:hypothetical protein